LDELRWSSFAGLELTRSTSFVVSLVVLAFTSSSYSPGHIHLIATPRRVHPVTLSQYRTHRTSPHTRSKTYHSPHTTTQRNINVAIVSPDPYQDYRIFGYTSEPVCSFEAYQKLRARAPNTGA